MLLLNQSYEPLTVCTVKKAIILVLLGKAELTADNRKKQLRSISRSYPWPTVIRLNSYIKLPYKKIILTRKNILKRDKHKCGYCGKGDIPLTIDHILPKARGGRDEWENLVSACMACNNKKGDRTPKEADMPLNIKPYKPNYIMFITKTANRLDESWRPFLFHA